MQDIFPVERSAAGSVSAIALRRGTNALTAPVAFPAHTADIELGFGHAATSPPYISFHFPTNRGQDYRRVVNRRLIQFPAVPYRADNMYQFSYSIPFDAPFTLQPDRWAVWELFVYPMSPCVQADTKLAYVANRNNGAWPVALGLPCPPSLMGDNTIYVPPLAVGWSNTVFMNPDLSSNHIGLEVLFLGARRDSWLGSPLPLDLTPYGAPGCSVQVSLDFPWPQSLTASTRNGSAAYFALDLPYDTRLVGADLFLQAVRYGVAAPLNVSLSQGVRAPLGAPIPPVGGIIFGPLGALTEYGQRVNASYLTELTVQ